MLERGDAAAASRIMDAHLHEIEASLSPTVAPDEPATVIQVLSRYTGRDDRPVRSHA